MPRQGCSVTPSLSHPGSHSPSCRSPRLPPLACSEPPRQGRTVSGSIFRGLHSSGGETDYKHANDMWDSPDQFFKPQRTAALGVGSNFFLEAPSLSLDSPSNLVSHL